MLRSLTVSAFMLVLLSASFASADSYDDCLKECGNVHTQCVEGITLYDETGVKEAKDVCTNDLNGCRSRCHDEATNTNVDVNQEKLKKEAEEAEKKRQEEQQETLDGAIKIYKFGD